MILDHAREEFCSAVFSVKVASAQPFAWRLNQPVLRLQSLLGVSGVAAIRLTALEHVGGKAIPRHLLGLENRQISGE
jgi:hypothetical protein